jgi:S-layer homology domain.
MFTQFKKTVTAATIVCLVICQFPATAFASSTADDIKYSMSSDEVLTFDDDDFSKVCDKVNDEDLNYVKFTLPDDDEGTLYYDYDEDASSKDQTEVSSSNKYYCDKTPKLSKVAFAPYKNFTGTLSISYKGYDDEGDTFTGKVKITVEKATSSSNVIKYTSKSGKSVTFDEDDFDDVCNNIQDEDLDYIQFSLPDKDDGILYYNYDKNEDSNTKVSASKKYYYDGSPYISKISFVPDDDFTGTVTIKYTGYDEDGDDYSGKIQISSEKSSSSSSSDEIINYTISTTSKTIKFDEDDFNKVCDKINDEDLDYIKLTIPSATKGILYYKYSNGNYSSAVGSGQKYYYDISPCIGDITFVPNSSFNGVVKINYMGYDDDGTSFSGVISISVGNNNSDAAKAINYSIKTNESITLKDSDFNSLSKELLGTQLNYVQFTLPSSSYGTLYYGYTASGSYTSKVKESTKYYYDSSPYLLNVTFVPANNVTGTVTVSYEAYGIDGSSFNGKVLINITSSGSSTTTWGGITLVSSKYFKDVDISYSWAVPYIDNLYEADIIAGTNTDTGSKLYSPASYVTRGDFILVLYRALNFSTSSTTSNFADVSSGTYYYTAIKMAKALGIVQGSDNKFYPNQPITREDAMVMALRAVNITGKTIPSGDVSNLTGFKDNSSISDYSKSAVSALVKAGIITGSDDSKIYPQGNLTRAQIAAIIYRIKGI